jgi:chaperonin cofactor prefoldin
MSVTIEQVLQAVEGLKDFTEANFVKLDGKIESLDAKVASLDVRTDRLERRLAKLEVRVGEGFNDLGRRLTELESRGRRR